MRVNSEHSLEFISVSMGKNLKQRQTKQGCFLSLNSMSAYINKKNLSQSGCGAILPNSYK